MSSKFEDDRKRIKNGEYHTSYLSFRLLFKMFRDETLPASLYKKRRQLLREEEREGIDAPEIYYYYTKPIKNKLDWYFRIVYSFPDYTKQWYASEFSNSSIFALETCNFECSRQVEEGEEYDPEYHCKLCYEEEDEKEEDESKDVKKVEEKLSKMTVGCSSTEEEDCMDSLSDLEE